MTNTTNLAVQTMPKTQPSASTPKAPASKAPEKTFQQVMQETTQQTQQPQTPAQSTTAANATDRATSNVKTSEQASGVTTEQNGMQGQDVSDASKLELVNGIEIDKAFTDVKLNFLGMLFGASALEGVDMEQSDMEILKDVYKNLTDPAEQFAMMMMMAFMQDNPDVSIEDFAGTLDQAAWSNPDVSPVQKVFTAITKMQHNQPMKSSDILNTLMQMAREMKTPALASKISGELPNFKELETMLMSQTNGKQQSNLQNAARTAGQDPAMLLQQGQAQFKDAVTQARQLMQNTAPATNTALDESQKADTTGGTGQKRETGVAIDVEKLQAQVDANSYMQNTSHQMYQLRQAGAVVTDQPEIDPMELINQVRTGILSGAQKDENEFVLKLRPEGLGELTIHLVETGAKMSLSIVASSAQTQKLLTSELANLQAAMKPLNVEVLPVTTNEQVSSSMEHALSGQLAQQQQFGEHNHGEQFDAPNRSFHPMNDEEQELQSAGYVNNRGTSALDTYI